VQLVPTRLGLAGALGALSGGIIGMLTLLGHGDS
jgi:hypothetical protein